MYYVTFLFCLRDHFIQTFCVTIDLALFAFIVQKAPFLVTMYANFPRGRIINDVMKDMGWFSDSTESTLLVCLNQNQK